MEKIQLSVTVDWEGENFGGINDLRLVRKQIGEHIPITHFICPSYFLHKPGVALRKMQKVILPHDEIALHFHSLKALVKAAGVEFRTAHNFYRPLSSSAQKTKERLPKAMQKIFYAPVTGRGVPLSVYSVAEIEQLVTFARDLLQNTTETAVTGFRAGGWMATDSVLSVLDKTGFAYDSSAVPPQIFSAGFNAENNGNMLDNYGDNNGIFTEYMLKLWGSKIQQTDFLANSRRLQTYPKAINLGTQPFRMNNIIEMPNNGGMSDFASPEATILPALQIAHGLISTKKPAFLNVGLHQEGEPSLKLPLVAFIKQIPPSMAESIHFTTVAQAANKFVLGINE